MSDAIVSHVANQAYRDHVDEMTCKADGCKRWRLDERSEFCGEHGKPPRLLSSMIADGYALERGAVMVKEHKPIKLTGLRDCAASLPADHVPGIGQNISRETP